MLLLLFYYFDGTSGILRSTKRHLGNSDENRVDTEQNIHKIFLVFLLLYHS